MMTSLLVSDSRSFPRGYGARDERQLGSTGWKRGHCYFAFMKAGLTLGDFLFISGGVQGRSGESGSFFLWYGGELYPAFDVPVLCLVCFMSALLFLQNSGHRAGMMTVTKTASEPQIVLCAVAAHREGLVGDGRECYTCLTAGIVCSDF